jgi:hypothetical protein
MRIDTASDISDDDNLPRTKLADLGFIVSVGIVLLSESRKAIVSISDRKVTLSDLSADYAAIKSSRLFSRCWVIEVGNDAEYAVPILGEASAGMLDKFGRGKIIHPAVVAQTLHETYIKHQQRQIEAAVLAKYGWTVDSFRRHGKKLCTETVYNGLCSKIEKQNISLEFIVNGFDDKGDGHIFVVDGRDTPRCYNRFGVWAVGSGSRSALAALTFRINSQQFDVHSSTAEEAAFFACEAKFMAES